MAGWSRFSGEGLPAYLSEEADSMPERRLDPADTFHVTPDSMDTAAERRADDLLSDYGSAAIDHRRKERD